MDQLRDFSKLHEATEKNLLDFLRTDLGLCSTFADLVRTEMQMRDGAAAQRVFDRPNYIANKRRTYLLHCIRATEGVFGTRSGSPRAPAGCLGASGNIV